MLRIRKIGILRFKKFITLFEFVVLVYRLEVHWPHVVQLCSKVGDNLFQVRGGELLFRGPHAPAGVDFGAFAEILLRVGLSDGRFVGGGTDECTRSARASRIISIRALFQLSAQNFFERRLIARKSSKIDLVAAGNMPEEIVDLHLELRFSDLPLCA